VQQGDSFILEVLIANATDLGAFEFDLSYNPAVIQVTEVQTGDFLGSTLRTIVPLPPNIDNDAGLLVYGAFSFGDLPGAEGDGVLVAITFQAQQVGATAVTFIILQITDSNAVVLLPQEVLDGSVTVE